MPIRHLIFLFDGTWNSAASGELADVTNIYRLNSVLKNEDKIGFPQITFYIPGPGTRGLGDKELGGLFGQGLDQIIREAYVNLSSNYRPKDKIYLFGFSRGAVAALALAAMISKCGLLEGKSINLLSLAWKDFVNSASLQQNEIDWYSQYCIDAPPVQFLGLFDPVLGRSMERPNIFSELTFDHRILPRIVERAVSILSIDDNRKTFAPTVLSCISSEQAIEQIWMPGVHGDVGGSSDAKLIGSVSLLTMIERVQNHTSLFTDEYTIDAIIRELDQSLHVSISNEREAIVMKALPYRDRRPPPHGVSQSVHNLLFVLYNEEIILRNKIRRYCAKRLDAFYELDPSEGEYFSKLRPLIYRILSNTRSS